MNKGPNAGFSWTPAARTHPGTALPRIWTVGHSTRTTGEFVALLQSAAITIVGDVRRFPGSRRYSQYNQPALTEALASKGMDYVALAELGGRRQPRPDSPHIAWRNPSFRAYADYMETDPFRHGVDRVIAYAARGRVALMCSEAVWWRCHRALIADYLKVHGCSIVHLFSSIRHEEHPYTSAARVVDGQLNYASATA